MKGLVAYSIEDRSRHAGTLLVADLKEKLSSHLDSGEDESPAVVLVFVSVAHDIDELTAPLREAWPELPMCGCTVFGNLSHLGNDDMTFSASMVMLCGEKLSASPFLYDFLKGNDQQIGENIGGFVNSHRNTDENALLFLFPDAWSVNMSTLFRGIEGSLGKSIDIVGGFASDDYQTEKTSQYANYAKSSNGVSGFLLQGDFQHEIVVSHGSRPMGGSYVVTKASGQKVLELNNQPALDILRDCLGADVLADYGQLANVLGLGFPFQNKNYSEDLLLRAVMGIDKEQKSIKLGGDVEEGSEVFFCLRNEENIAEATTQMTGELLSRFSDLDSLFFLYFNCDGRGTYLYGEPGVNVETLMNALPNNNNFAGFFTFGEIAPFNGRNMLHNYTGVLLGMK